MQIYVGYGFDVSSVSDADLLNLMRKHDPNEFECFADDTRENYGITDEKELEEAMLDDVRDRIMENNMDCTEYLRDIINNGEKQAAGTDYIVSALDQFLLFDSLRFGADEKRGEYIRSQSDFIQMIARYIPVENLSFGNIYTGSEWTDGGYYQE